LALSKYGEGLYEFYICEADNEPRSECHARIDRVDGAIYQKTESWADAFAIYSLAYDDGTIEVVPIADGVYDAPRFTIPSSNGRPGTAQVNLPHPGRRNNNITQPHEISRPRKLGAHIYAVYRGEEVGVYGSWYIFYFPLVSCLIGLLLLLGMKWLLVRVIWQAFTISRRSTPGRMPSEVMHSLTERGDSMLPVKSQLVSE